MRTVKLANLGKILMSEEEEEDNNCKSVEDECIKVLSGGGLIMTTEQSA